jgi:hypothetical protein
MASPTAWDSTVEPLCGENDPFGRKDTANQYARELWSNLTAEHYKADGAHKAPLAVSEWGTYTATGKKQTVTLVDTDIDISYLEVYPHVNTTFPYMKISDWNGVDEWTGSYAGNLAIESNAADGNTTFTDLYGTHTIVANGDVQHKTAVNQGFNASSIYFDGTGDYLSIADHADWDFGTNDFCVSFDVYFVDKDANTYACFLDHNDWRIWYEDGNTRITVTIEGTAYHYTWSPSENTWYRVEVYRLSNDDLYVAVDRTSLGSNNVSDNITGATDALTIGCDVSATSTYFLNGYMDDIFINSDDDFYKSWSLSKTVGGPNPISGIWRLGQGKFQLHGSTAGYQGTHSYQAIGVVL